MSIFFFLKKKVRQIFGWPVLVYRKLYNQNKDAPFTQARRYRQNLSFKYQLYACGKIIIYLD